MAITFTTSHLDSAVGIEVPNIYCRVATYEMKSRDANGPFTRDESGNETDTLDTNHPNYKAAHIQLTYGVILHRTEGARNGAREEMQYWPNRVRCILIDRFKFDVTLADMEANTVNPYKLIYANLKTQIAAIRVDGSAIVSSIADAI